MKTSALVVALVPKLCLGTTRRGLPERGFPSGAWESVVVLLLALAAIFTERWGAMPTALGGHAWPRKAVAMAPDPESRALEYLVTEVPRWSTANKCFSCHNNGDGARALYTGLRLGFAVPAQALAATSDWLRRPDQWDQIDAAAGSSDKGLARIQFAAALVEAVDARSLKDRERLSRAADLVAEHQKKDGSWQVDAPGNIGSPATYGPALATYLARRTLQKADAKRYKEAIVRADGWLEQAPIKNVLDAAAVLLALKDSSTGKAASQRRQCLELIQKGEAKEGGWGPYVHSPPEPFDTAVVLLALSHTDRPGCKDMLQRGRTFLTASQQEDGSWKETTRPAGAKSYAQRISTTAWATIALLETSEKAK